MTFFRNIIHEKNIDVKTDISLIKKGISVYGLYLICVDSKNPVLMQILSCKQALKKISDTDGLVVIGMAKTSSSARELVKRIIENYLVRHTDLNGFKAFYTGQNNG